MGPKGDTSAIGLKHPREIKKNSQRAFRLSKIHIHCAPLNRGERRHDTSASGRLRARRLPGLRLFGEQLAHLEQFLTLISG